MHKTVYLETLGCDKNTVNSDYLIGELLGQSFSLTTNPETADLLMINTCCFIEKATQESIDTIFDLYNRKKDKAKLIVTGCLVERYGDELKPLFPEVDVFIGKEETEALFSSYFNDEKTKDTHRFIEDKPYAYLKISEGCNNHCTYCIIPRFKGKHISRDIKSIIKEAKELEAHGVKELILVAQDLTQYGSDLVNGNLVSLLKTLVKECHFKWIRMLYLYPEGITEELLNFIKSNPTVLPYFDIPIQHTSDTVLQKMGRGISKKDIIEKIKVIRENLPDSVIRSTVITGFPGETQEDFEELCKDLKSLKLDRLGAFSYSREEGTPAHDFDGQLPKEIKEERMNVVNALQNDIMTEQNERFVRKTVDVLVEEQIDEETVSGRFYADAPEIDCITYIHTDKELLPGDIVKVKIIQALGYDFIGEIDESTK